MTIEKRSLGLWAVICDECGDVEDLDTDPDAGFKEAVADVKALGYKFIPPAPGEYGWEHICPDCR